MVLRVNADNVGVLFLRHSAYYDIMQTTLLLFYFIERNADKNISTCSYRVRGADGSCAKHLTIESYTVVMLPTFILFHSRLKTFLFCKSFPPQPSFSSSALTTQIPRTVY